MQLQSRDKTNAPAAPAKAAGEKKPAPAGFSEKAHKGALKVQAGVRELLDDQKGTKVRRTLVQARVGIKRGKDMTAAVEYAREQKWIATEGVRPKYLIPL
jgi:hypothetical protein